MAHCEAFFLLAYWLAYLKVKEYPTIVAKETRTITDRDMSLPKDLRMRMASDVGFQSALKQPRLDSTCPVD